MVTTVAGIDEDAYQPDRFDIESGAWMASTEYEREDIRRRYSQWVKDGRPAVWAMRGDHGYVDPDEAPDRWSPITEIVDAIEDGFAERLDIVKRMATEPRQEAASPSRMPQDGRKAGSGTERQATASEGQAARWSASLGMRTHRKDRFSQTPAGRHQRLVRQRAARWGVSEQVADSRLGGSHPGCLHRDQKEDQT